MEKIADVIGLFFLFSGFVIGLGAVTVIDVAGFLGRKSSYWTEVTIKIHKITKPLIWIGIGLAFLGGLFFYRNESLSGIPLIQMIMGIFLVLNGAFLSFVVSPFLLKREEEGKADKILPNSWQKKITVSLIVSDLGWWGSLFLLVIYLLKS